MAESSWPSPSYNSGAVSSAEYEAMNYYVGGGMMGLYNETAAIFADSSGRQIKIRAARYAVIHGFNWYSGTSDTTVAIAANASGSTRVDRVVLRLTRATWQVRVAVIAGTPGAGAPAYTQTYSDSGVFEISLALVTVVNAAATLAAGDVVFHASYFAPTPMITPSAASTPLTTNNTARSYVGQTYLDAATGAMRFHSGSALRQVADTATLGASTDSMNWPFCRLILPSAFGVANNSNSVSIPFGSGSEQFKSHASMHSTTVNNTRIIPTQPGIYLFSAVTVFAPNTSGFRTHSIGKNGSRQASEAGIYSSSSLPVGANAVLPMVSVELAMNGSTDYAELFAYQSSGGTLNIVGDGTATSTGNTTFVCKYLRPLIA